MSDERHRCRLTICNPKGLHARAAAKFVKTVDRFDADVVVARNGQSVGGDSIMGLMMLAAGLGMDIEISAAGPEADAVLEALRELVTNGFGEI